MNKFFDEENISNEHLSFFENVFLQLENNNIDGALFCGFPFVEISEETKNIAIRGLIICSSGLYMFCENDNEKKLYRRHINKVMMDGNNISEILIDNPKCLSFFNMSDKIEEILIVISQRDDIFSTDVVREAISIIQNILHLIPKDNREIRKENSIGAKIVRRSNIEANFDEQQFKLVYQENDNNMRIRGLAGSGKTILLVKKLAYLHFKNPDLDLAYVFFTKSLKQSIDNFFIRFYKEMDKYGGKPNMQKIHIMHGWGNSQNPGLYSIVCSKLGYMNEQYSRGNDLNKICGNLIEKVQNDNRIDEIQLFDYILIDEAQDFRINFFNLAVKTLKQFGKLIYAYDELQTLNEYNVKMPEPKDIFESNIVCIDKNLPTCYRSPREIIVTAHALGLGIYHKDSENKIEYCNVIEDKTIWQATGYKIIDGELDYGKKVKLGRDVVIKNEIQDVIVAENVGNNDQNKKAIIEIVNLIKNEDVSPEDILIIDLDTIGLNENYSKFLKSTIDYFEQEKLIDENGKRLFELNLVNKESSYSFKLNGSISYTTIFRAKGNEANIVFVLNSDMMSSQISFNRNKIFTAMTRAKFKVYLYGKGNGMEAIINEIQSVKDNDYTLNFTYPTKEEMQKYKDRFYLESQRVTKFETFFSEYQNRSKGDKKELIKMIIEQCSQEELLDVLGEINKNG